jgi:hypothetical protein
MSGGEQVKPVHIVEYKKTILDMFNDLTEFEIKATVDAAKEQPEYSGFADIYISAVTRCRQILDIILEGTTNGC